jgi:hypothetical protein
MSRIVQTPLPPMAVKRVDEVQPPTAPADSVSSVQSIRMTAVVKDALLRHYGSFKAAAITMGEMDQGQLARDLDSGKFKFERLELCDAVAKGFIAAALYEAFGHVDPKERVRRLIRNAHRAIDELAEAVA